MIYSPICQYSKKFHHFTRGKRHFGNENSVDISLLIDVKVHQMGKLVVIRRNSKCSFCGISKNDFLNYGPIYKLGKLKAHYYCVLLSNNLKQSGDDNEGILGFLLSDIQKELQRASNILCFYCKKGNATLQCAVRKCRKSFHLPCGIQKGSLHEFFDHFKSYCHKHRPVQKIPPDILKEAAQTNVICCICYDKVNVKHTRNSLWAPCCVRTWYHRLCIQKLAHSAGYFFRCAACNDVQKFIKWMQKFGIFIPQKDASWELVPNAFEELLHRHNKCDAKECKCPNGRQKNVDNTIWEIVLCGSCGSQGIHIACGSLKFLDPEWECPDCQNITKKLNSPSKTVDSLKPVEGSSNSPNLTEVCRKKRRRGSEDLKNSVLDKRKKLSYEEEKTEDLDEIDIDVETVEEEIKNKDVPDRAEEQENDILSVEVVEIERKEKTELEDALAILKPGPLSYKLSVIQKACQSSLPKKSGRELKENIDVIEISDSDEGEDEEEEEDDDDDDDVKVIKSHSECESDDFNIITPNEVKDGSEEGECGVSIEVIDGDVVGVDSEKLSFSFNLHTNKWEFGNSLSRFNEDPSKTGFSKEVIPLKFSSRSANGKRAHRSSHEDEDSVQVRKSDFREEKDFRTVSDDDVIILTD